MVDNEHKRWNGVVTNGELTDWELEVRRQDLPWALYVLAFSAPDDEEPPLIGFAIGREQLVGHLEGLGVEVTWEDGRGPLAPERDRPDYRAIRRRQRARRVRPPVRPMQIGAGFSTRRVA